MRGKQALLFGVLCVPSRILSVPTTLVSSLHQVQYLLNAQEIFSKLMHFQKKKKRRVEDKEIQLLDRLLVEGEIGVCWGGFDNWVEI